MRWNKIPDDVLWKEEIGKSGYTAYFVASCKKQGEQFYSRTDLLIFWHKTSVNVARRENRVILDILLQKYNVCGFIHTKHIHNNWSSSHWHLSWWCIHPGLPHASECRVFLKLLVYNLEMTAGNKFCTKRNMVILDILLKKYNLCGFIHA